MICISESFKKIITINPVVEVFGFNESFSLFYQFNCSSVQFNNSIILKGF
jgi:hypothetical protein